MVKETAREMGAHMCHINEGISWNCRVGNQLKEEDHITAQSTLKEALGHDA